MKLNGIVCGHAPAWNTDGTVGL